MSAPERDPRWEGVSAGVTFQPEMEVFDHHDETTDGPIRIPARYRLVLEVPTPGGTLVQISYIPAVTWGYSEVVRATYSTAVARVDDQLDRLAAERWMTPGAKPDERDLWTLVYLHRLQPRAAGEVLGIHPKRVRGLCAKWDRRGIYDYGVSIDTGWADHRLYEEEAQRG